MAELKTKRLSKVARELNVGLATIVDFLQSKGIDISQSPNTKIDDKSYSILLAEFQQEKNIKEESQQIVTNQPKDSVSVNTETKDKKTPAKKPENGTSKDILIKDISLKGSKDIPTPKKEKPGLKVVGKIDVDKKKKEEKPTEKDAEKAKKPEEKSEKKETEKTKEDTTAQTEDKDNITKDDKKEKEKEQHAGPKVLGKIEIPKDKPKQSLRAMHGEFMQEKRQKRKRIKKETGKVDTSSTQDEKGKFAGKRKSRRKVKPELTEEEIQKQVKETLAKLSERTKSKAVKFRREKRDQKREQIEEEAQLEAEGKKVLKVTEFVSANELAQMMEVPVNEIISACMTLGLFVSINQRLDAETISLIVEEFGFTTEFVSAEIQESKQDEEEDDPKDLIPKAPIVTVMGHVDHGKTSLLDNIRKENVIAGESGGITQHIGAYSVITDDNKKITFIDTPGHEAFTAMRARGAQATDIAIIVIAADDSVMPQTIEAINHAKAAGVPIVFAFNKIDKPGANADKIREALSGMNYLVEEWGGKYQAQEVSAKKGENIDLLLEKVLLEAEMLELKANPKRLAKGTVIEAKLDKGRGFVTTLLVQNGSLRIGDVVLAGTYSGRVKALYNERGQNVKEAEPSTPIIMLGLSGAPQAGDNFSVMEDEREARELATKRLQLQREQGMRAKKHITLDEIGRRIAIGDFQQLNIIIKGDSDGSIEALSDSFLKLSTENIKVNIIHKSVGAISESDVLLASASNAIIIGFQVRPAGNAKTIAEREEIDIRTYSVIYKAIDELKDAMEGMLAPTVEEKVQGNIEVRDVFNISKIGKVAGCYVLDGKVSRNNHVRLIRDGIVIHSGKIKALKRFKEDVKEVKKGYECGLSIEKFDDIKAGDIIEAFEEVEVKRKL